MTTYLRAALRDAAAALKSEAYNKRQTMHAELFGDRLPIRYDEIAARLVALADAPPTVAELVVTLPEPKVGTPRMAVEWTWPASGLTFRARRSGAFGLVVERNEGAAGWRAVKGLCHADLTQPARLVEVTP